MSWECQLSEHISGPDDPPDIGNTDCKIVIQYETLWFSIFRLLKAQQQLQALKVSFAKWTVRIDNADGLDPVDEPTIWESRHGVIRTLLSFRGLDRVLVVPGPFLNKYCTDVIEDALVMSPGQTTQRVTEFEHDVRIPRRNKWLPSGIVTGTRKDGLSMDEG